MSLNAPRRYGYATVAFTAFFVAFFSPALLHGKYLTWGDGLTDGLPAFFGIHGLWEPNIMLGNPWPANLNGYWYPLGWLRLIPNSFNAYMIAAYVLASVGTLGLVRALTGSWLAGCLGAVVYSLGGFMTSHSGHYNVVQPAAWTPWVMWSLARLQGGVTARWLCIAALSVAMCALAGQPQVIAYTLYLGLAYVLSMSVGSTAWKRNVPAAFVALLLGLALAAVAFLPASELARNSVRADMSFNNFIGYSDKPAEIPIRLFFPYFLGVTPAPLYPYSRFDFDTYTELSCYAGIGSLVLAVLALVVMRRSKHVWFWGLAALVALIASTGDYLHVGQFFYHLPLLGMFRAQGRHALEFTLAAAVLAGYGVASIEQGRARMSSVLASLSIVAALMGATLVGIVLLDTGFAGQVAGLVATGLPLTPWRNPALGIPLLILLIDAAAIVLLVSRKDSFAARVALLAAIVIDLSSFSWFGLPHVQTSPADLQPPTYVDNLRSDLGRHHARVLSFSGSAPPMVLPPNISLLWSLPEAGGHVQMEPVAIAEFLQMLPTGTVPTDLYARSRDAALDLAAVRFVALPPQNARRSIDAPFGAGNLNVSVGAPAWGWSKSFSVGLPEPAPATRFLVVSFMSDSTEIRNGTRVAEISFVNVRGKVSTLPLLAGRDTAEIAYDVPAVRAAVKHARAHVFSTVGVSYHAYLTELRLPSVTKVRNLTVRWLYGSPVHGYLTISNLTLVDDTSGRAQAVVPENIFESDPKRWVRIGNTDPDVLFQNRAAFPRAWTVHHVVRLPDASALLAIRNGTLDFHRAAVIDRGSNGNPDIERSSIIPDSVTVKDLTATRMTLKAACASACFLVTSDLFYPGWHAFIDGKRVPLYRADYALRGVAVPSGDHSVTFSYLPRSFVVGAAITLTAAGMLILICFTPLTQRLNL